MTFDLLIAEVLADAKRTVDRRRTPSSPYDPRQRCRAIAELAADMAIERFPRLEWRLGREKLVEHCLSEIGD